MVVFRSSETEILEIKASVRFKGKFRENCVKTDLSTLS